MSPACACPPTAVLQQPVEAAGAAISIASASNSLSVAQRRVDGGVVATEAVAPFTPPLILRPPRVERVEPLSAGRYKVQFTADERLKGRLELARDLMRHSLPSGDFAPIIARALDLLIEKLMKQRFGASTRRRNESSARKVGPGHEEERTMSAARTVGASGPGMGARNRPSEERLRKERSEERLQKERSEERLQKEQVEERLQEASEGPSCGDGPLDERSLCGGSTAGWGDEVAVDGSGFGFELAGVTPEPASAVSAASASQGARTRAPEHAASGDVGRATRRAVVERDGLRCSWRGPDGGRCEARAWLEYDHVHPRGKGGSSSVENMRLLCRPHNRRAAELEYGRRHVDECWARRARAGDRAGPID